MKRIRRRQGADQMRALRRAVPAIGVISLLAIPLTGLGAQSALAATTDSYQAVFQANDNVLYGYTSAPTMTSTTLGMESGTSPSAVQLSDGTFMSAFQANNNTLYLHKWSGTNTSTTLGMDPGSSPVLAALPTGAGWVAAFQANNHDLYIYTSAGTKTDTGLGMQPGTSPSVAVQPNGAWAVAFQANNGTLHTYGSGGGNAATTNALDTASSPSIIPLADGTYEIAFEANNDVLDAYHTAGSTLHTTLGMAPGTSPSIAVQGNSSWAVAFQANTNQVATYSFDGSSNVTGNGMEAGTSPSIIPEPDGSYEVAFQANNDYLSVYHTGGTTNDTTLGMIPGTSPSLAVTAPAPPAGQSTPGTGGCGAAEDCTPATFAGAVLAGIGAPVTASSEYAITQWADREHINPVCSDQAANGSSWWTSTATVTGNPLDTTLPEPGSQDEPGNTVPVQEYNTADGATCWQWGIQATVDTIVNTNVNGQQAYAGIISVLRSPSSSDLTQCDNLSAAEASSPWGTGDFSSYCSEDLPS